MAEVAEKAQSPVWDALCAAPPDDVCARAAVTYDPALPGYRCLMLGQPILVDVARRKIESETPLGRLMLERHECFSQLSVLHYLAYARGVPSAGRFVTPAELISGQIYLRGSHILPTDQVAAKFGTAPDRFRDRGRQFGGERLDYGDAAVRLLPLPRLAVAIVLWVGDDEFPARANFLLDAACERQVAPDVVWAVAMLTLRMFAEDDSAGRAAEGGPG